MNKKVIFILSFLSMGMILQQNASAQLTELNNFMSIGPQDAKTLFSAYLKPLGNSFGSDMNSGWYSTAKPHKLLGFDVTLSVSVAVSPSSDNSFNLSNIGLSSNCIYTQNATSPSFTGSSNPGPQISYNLGGGKEISFIMPAGIGYHFIPMPMLQAGIGLPFETEIVGRYIPKIDLGEHDNIQLEGIGIKHSIKQYLPFIRYAPFFHLSVFAGYTQITENTVLNALQPSDLGLSTFPSGVNFSNENMEVQIKAFTGDLVASFDLPIITVYAGAGIGTSSTSLNMSGNYPTSSSSFIDGLDMNISNGGVQPRINAGFKLKLGLIAFHVDYTEARYSVITAGLGFSFR